ERQKFRVPRDRWISLESDAVSVLRDQLGEENVKVEDN
ncbi:DNA polymerase III subunit alpha, partial [human gut metagenome]